MFLTSSAAGLSPLSMAILLLYTSKFSRRPIFADCYFQHFTEKIFADQEFSVYSILKFRELNFCGLLKSAKITCLENLDVYGTTTCTTITTTTTTTNERMSVYYQDMTCVCTARAAVHTHVMSWSTRDVKVLLVGDGGAVPHLCLLLLLLIVPFFVLSVPESQKKVCFGSSLVVIRLLTGCGEGVYK